jgi:hypothetical protein
MDYFDRASGRSEDLRFALLLTYRKLDARMKLSFLRELSRASVPLARFTVVPLAR